MSLQTILRNDFSMFFRRMRYQLFQGANLKIPHTGRITVQCRPYSEIEKTLEKPISNKIVTKLRQFDKVGHDYDLIYRAPRTIAFTATHVCLLLSGVTLPTFGYIIADLHDFKFPIRATEQLVLIGSMEQFYVFLGLTAFILSSMFILVNRFPLRIYCRRKTNDYIAAYSHILLPWKMEHVNFKKGDVRRIKESEILVFQLANYKINGRKNILIEEHFSRPADLELMIDPNYK